MNLKINFALAIFFALILLQMTAAEGATLRGRVDVNGVGVAGANVEARNTRTNAVSNTKTDGRGNYAITRIPVGIYAVRVFGQGFPERIEPAVRVNPERRKSNAIGAINATIMSFPTAAIINRGGAASVNIGDDTPRTIDEEDEGTTILDIDATGTTSCTSEASSLRGIIVDAETNKALSGASISITNSETSMVFSTITDARGLYQFENLCDGNYKSAFTMTDYETKNPDIQIGGGAVRTRNVEMNKIKRQETTK